jgi:hypothetical protein
MGSVLLRWQRTACARSSLNLGTIEDVVVRLAIGRAFLRPKGTVIVPADFLTIEV